MYFVVRDSATFSNMSIEATISVINDSGSYSSTSGSNGFHNISVMSIYCTGSNSSGQSAAVTMLHM